MKGLKKFNIDSATFKIDLDLFYEHNWTRVEQDEFKCICGVSIYVFDPYYLPVNLTEATLICFLEKDLGNVLNYMPECTLSKEEHVIADIIE